jgi:hypothetical protein
VAGLQRASGGTRSAKWAKKWLDWDTERGTARSRQDEPSKEVGRVGSKRTSSGCNGVHVVRWVGLIFRLLPHNVVLFAACRCRTLDMYVRLVCMYHHCVAVYWHVFRPIQRPFPQLIGRGFLYCAAPPSSISAAPPFFIPATLPPAKPPSRDGIESPLVRCRANIRDVPWNI